jgi:hypothetical protein
MQLVIRNADNIRCFTIGMGRGADPGLVKGIAVRTRGRYDFVYDGVDLRSKVIPQLEASMAPAIEDVHVDVLGASGQFCIPDPIQPITPGNLSVNFVRCHHVSPNPKVLVSGRQQGRDVRQLTPTANSCMFDDVNCAVSKYIESLRLIDLEQKISKLEKDPEIYDALKRQAIDISTKSGIMCAFTSFVAVLPRPPRADVRDSDGQDRNSIQIFLRDVNGGHVALRVDPYASISTLRSLIYSKTAVAPSNQILCFAGKILESGTLRDYPLHENSTIEMSPGLRGGMHIFVRWVKDGRHVAIEVQPDESISGLKEKIQSQMGMRVVEQVLTYKGKPLVTGTLLDYSVQKHCVIDLEIGVSGGGGPMLMISDIEPGHKEHNISDLLSGHSVDGCWLHGTAMRKLAGLKHRPRVPDVAPGLRSKVQATLIALALLRKYHSDEYELWRLLELKAIQWLNRFRTRASWSDIIDEVVAALR